MTKCARKAFCYGIILAVVFSAFIQSATAKVLRWELQNVKFQDGRIASGFFLFDADSVPDPRDGIFLTLVSWDISVQGTGGTGCTPFFLCFPDYRFSSNEGGAEVYPDKSFLNINSKSFNNDLRVHLSLTLAFDPPLSNDGGELSVVGWEYWTYYDEGSGIAIGQVVAIPEPAETVFLAVYLTGLVGFCMARAQKKIFVT